MFPDYFLTWLEDPNAVRCVLVHAIANVNGVETSFFMSNLGYVGSRTDPNAQDLEYEACIIGGCEITERLNIDGTASLTIGDIEISNVGGERDAWLQHIWRNRQVQMYVGDARWERSEFVLVFSGVIYDIGARDRNVLNLQMRDVLERLNVAITEDKIGGDSIQSDKLVPLCFGEVHNVEPVLVDKATMRYQVHNGPIEQVIEARDNGIPVVTQSVLTNGQFTLERSVFGQLTCSIQGSARILDNAAYSNNIAHIIKYIVKNYGPTETRFSDAEIDLSNFNVFSFANPQAVGVYTKDRANILEVCNMLASSVGAQLTATPQGKLRLVKIDLPVQGATPTVVNESNIAERSLELVERIPVKGAVKLAYCRNWTIQNNMVSGVLNEHKALYADEWLTITMRNSDVINKYMLTGEPVQEPTLLLVKQHAQEETDRRLTLWRTPRAVYRYTGFSELMGQELGGAQIIEHRRFGMNLPQSAQIVGITRNWLTFRPEIEILTTVLGTTAEAPNAPPPVVLPPAPPPPPPAPVPVPPSAQPMGGLPAKVLGCYFTAWDTAYDLEDVPMDFNVIYLFNAQNHGNNTDNGAWYWPFTAEITSTEVQAVRARGQKVILSLGGAGLGFAYNTRTQSQNCVNSAKSIIASLGGVDGIDFNFFEAGVRSVISEVVWIAQQFKATYGANFAIVAPPGAINTGGTPVNGIAMADAYDLNLMGALADAGVLTYAGPQYYDWSFFNQPGSISEVNKQWVARLGSTRAVLGLSANYPNGPSLSDCIREWDAAIAQFPDLRGMFCWNAQTNLAGGNTWGSTMRTKIGALPSEVPVNYPFGSRKDAYPFGVKPNNATAAQMDATIKSHYISWRDRNLRSMSGTSLPSDSYVIRVANDTSSYSTLSSNVGYGMLLFVAMAGYDPNAKKYFDGLLRTARSRTATALPATIGSVTVRQYLMEWRLDYNGASGGQGFNAMDGDMDIALALLMAHRQWGSSGAWNYLAEALGTVNALKAANFKTDGTPKPLTTAVDVVRTADFMFQHYREFSKYTMDSFWSSTAYNRALDILERCQNVFSAANGGPGALVPDYVVNSGGERAGQVYPLGSNFGVSNVYGTGSSNYVPSPGNLADGNDTEMFYYRNAQRLPWRIGVGYLFDGNARTRAICNRLINFFKSYSGGDPARTPTGFRLNGTLDGHASLVLRYPEYTPSGMVGPQLAGAMVDSNHQAYLNALWSFVTENFDNTNSIAELQLIPMLIASGNWWLANPNEIVIQPKEADHTGTLYAIEAPNTDDFSATGQIALPARVGSLFASGSTHQPDTFSSSGQEFLMLTAYGAVGNGTTNNWTAFQNAFAAAASTGKTILVPDGVFGFEGPGANDVLVMQGIKMQGMSQNAVIHAFHWNKAAIFLKGSGCVLKNLKLTTAGIAGTTYTRQSRWEASKIALLGGTTNFVIDRVRIEGAPAASIHVTQAANNGVIRNCTIIGSLADSIHITDRCNYIEVHNNEIYNSGDDGVACVSYQFNASPCHHLTVHHNKVMNNKNGRNLSIVGGEDNYYYQNYCENGGAGDAPYAGLYVTAEQNPDWQTWPCKRNRLERNTIKNCGTTTVHASIMHYSDAPVSDDNDFVRNWVTNATTTAGFRAFGPQLNVLLDQNKIDNGSGNDYEGVSGDPDFTLITYSSGLFGQSEPVGPTASGSGTGILNATDNYATQKDNFAATGTVSGNNLISTLTDGFASFDTAKWAQDGQANTSLAVTGGQLRLSVADANVGWRNVRSIGRYKLSGSSIHTRFVQPLQETYAQSGAETGFNVVSGNDNGTSGRLGFSINSDGNILAYYHNGATYNFLGSAVYNANTHGWLRIREASGTVFLETAKANSDTPAAGAKIATLNDSFNNLDSTKWQQYVNGGTASIVSNTLELDVNETAVSTIGYYSQNAYDLTESEAYVQINRIHVTTAAVDGARLIFRIFDDANGGDYVEWFIDSSNNLAARVCDEGTPTVTFVVGQWNSTNHKWLKISKSGTSVTFWTAPDNGGVPGTWTSQYVASTLPSTFAVCRPTFMFEYWNPAAGTITQTPRFDGFNTSVNALNPPTSWTNFASFAKSALTWNVDDVKAHMWTGQGATMPAVPTGPAIFDAINTGV